LCINDPPPSAAKKDAHACLFGQFAVPEWAIARSAGRYLPEGALLDAHATVPLWLPRSAEKAQDHA